MSRQVGHCEHERDLTQAHDQRVSPPFPGSKKNGHHECRKQDQTDNAGVIENEQRQACHMLRRPWRILVQHEKAAQAAAEQYVAVNVRPDRAPLVDAADEVRHVQERTKNAGVLRGRSDTHMRHWHRV